MPVLPTTALTFHIDASDTDNLFTTAGNPSSGTPSDGSAVQAVDDDDNKDLSLKFGTAGAEANWRTTTPLMALPCLDFDGAADFYELFDNAGLTGPQATSTVITDTDYVILASIYVENVVTNEASIENNEALLSDDLGQVFGIFFKNNAGTVTLNIYNWDGNADVLSLSMSLNTRYVLVVWHTGGNVSAELYSTAGLADSDTMASGTTTNLAGEFRVGQGRDAVAKFYNGRLGELAIYNAHDATDRANATQYFRDKWVRTPITFVNSTALTIGTAASTWSIPTHSSRVGGAGFFVGLGPASSAVTISTVTDNTTNVYKLAVERGTPKPAAGAALWYATSISSGSTRISVTLSGNSSGSLAVAQFTGFSGIAATDALLSGAGSSAITTNSSLHGANEFTPSTTESVVVWYARTHASTMSPVTIDGSFTAWTSTDAAVRQCGGYLLQTWPKSTVSGQWRSGAGSSGGVQHAEVMAAFINVAPSASGYWTPTTFSLLGVQ